MNRAKKPGRRTTARKEKAPSALQETSRIAQRRLILDVAARLVAEKPEGFGMRELASAVGASTTVLYNRFGSRDEIVVTLFQESLERLGDEFERVTGPDPFWRIVQLGYAYRKYALSNPHFIMALTQAPRAMGVAGARIRESRSHAVLIRTVQECIDAGIFAPGDARAIADILWTSVHGVVSLEVAGYFPGPAQAESHAHATAEAVIRGLLARTS